MAGLNWLLGKQRFSIITARLIAVHMVLTALIAAVLGPSTFISFQAVLLILFFDACLIASLVYSGRSPEILLTTNWFMILFFLPRLTAFQLFPAQTINFPALEPFTPEEIERGLLYIVFGYLMIWAGIACSTKLYGRFFSQTARMQSPRAVTDHLPGIILFCLMTFAGSMYVTHFLGVSIFSTNPQDWGNRMGWVARVFDTDLALLLLVVWFVANPDATRGRRLAAIALVALWLLISMDGGSRGGALRIIILVGLAAVAIFGDPRTSVKQVLALVFVSYLASMVIFPVATVLRMVPTSGAEATQNLTNDWYKPSKSQESKHWPTRDYLVRSPAFSYFAATLSPVVTRLGLIDYPIEIVARKPVHPEVIEHYLTLTYSLKNFANNMVPGEIFENSDIMTSRVFTMAYRNYGETHVRTIFLSEPWTLWGLSYIKGGPFGGLAIIFALSMMIQVGMLLIQRLPAGYAPYAAAAYLFVPVLSGFLQVFGIDHWLTISAHFSIAFLAAVLVIEITDRVARRIPGRRAHA